jgi:hypothetical protein
MRFAGLLSFLPQEFFPVLLVLGGLLMIVGLRSLAMTIFGLLGILIVAPIILEPLLAGLPDWALSLVIIMATMSAIALLISLLIGDQAWQEAKGNMAANVITWIFLFPFRVIGWILGRLFGRR